MPAARFLRRSRVGKTWDSLRGRRNVILPGQYYDPETGLHYNWHRSLDPATGRYTKSDPIGLRGGLNTYAYVKNNPVRNYDPNGLEIVCGDRWCGSDLPAYPKPKKCGCSQYQLNAGVGGELSGFFLFGGAAVSATGIAGTDGKICSLVTICGRLGLGMWAGGEVTFPVGGTQGGTENAGGWDVGCGFDLGWGVAAGGDISIGNGSAQAQVIPGVGAGWGGWGGGQLCRSFISCKKVVPDCECQQ